MLKHYLNITNFKKSITLVVINISKVLILKEGFYFYRKI